LEGVFAGPPHFEKIGRVSDNQTPGSASVHDSNDTCYTSAIWSLVVGNRGKLDQFFRSAGALSARFSLCSVYDVRRVTPHMSTHDHLSAVI